MKKINFKRWRDNLVSALTKKTYRSVFVIFYSLLVELELSLKGGNSEIESLSL